MQVQATNLLGDSSYSAALAVTTPASSILLNQLMRARCLVVAALPEQLLGGRPVRSRHLCAPLPFQCSLMTCCAGNCPIGWLGGDCSLRAQLWTSLNGQRVNLAWTHDSTYLWMQLNYVTTGEHLTCSVRPNKRAVCARFISPRLGVADRFADRRRNAERRGLAVLRRRPHRCCHC